MSKLGVAGMVTAALAATACGKNEADVDSAPGQRSGDTLALADHSAMHGGDSTFASMQKRGQMAMGVDQYMNAHKFDITDDGGRIELQSSKSDSLDIAQIRAHMKLIQHAFAAGDFSTPGFVHGKDMPGTAVMSQKKSLIRYEYADLPRGAEVRIATSDPEGRNAVAAFIQAQRGEHRASGTDKR